MAIRDILRAQDGLISRAQARDAGMSAAVIEHRLATGEWVRVRPRVFLSTAHPWSERARIRAEMLWLGPEATLIGVAATWWWRLTDVPAATVRIAAGPGCRVRPRGQVMVERRQVPAGDRVQVDGVWVTTRAQAVVDAVRVLGRVAGSDLLDSALLSGRVTLDGLRVAHCATVGRRGSGTMARLLPAAAGGARFEAERRMHAVLRDAGIHGWVADHRVVLPDFGPAVLDIAFPQRRLVIEIDGWACHRELAAFRRDPRRQNALILDGWTVLRVTWHDVVSRPKQVLAEVRRALAS